MTKKELLLLLENANSMRDLSVGFGYSANYGAFNKAKIINEYKNIGIDLKTYWKDRIWTTRCCPVCQKQFDVRHKETKLVCSKGCANTYYRSGENHGNWKPEAYRSTCFEYHDKKCVVCGEYHIVTVHHLDHNKNNNNPDNLIPLCPTHHQYWHSRHRHLIEKAVFDYIKIWKNNGD